MDRIWIVKRTSYFELRLVNIVHGELALRLAQAHQDALKSVVDDDNSLVSEKSELKCGGRDTPPEMREGLAHCLPDYVSQQVGDCPNAVCVFSQIRLFLPLVAPDLHT